MNTYQLTFYLTTGASLSTNVQTLKNINDFSVDQVAYLQWKKMSLWQKFKAWIGPKSVAVRTLEGTQWNYIAVKHIVMMQVKEVNEKNTPVVYT